MTKFMINNRTDAWKTDVNLLNSHYTRVSITHHKFVWKDECFKLLRHTLVQIGFNTNPVTEILSIEFLFFSSMIKCCLSLHTCFTVRLITENCNVSIRDKFHQVEMFYSPYIQLGQKSCSFDFFVPRIKTTVIGSSRDYLIVSCY